MCSRHQLAGQDAEQQLVWEAFCLGGLLQKLSQPLCEVATSLRSQACIRGFSCPHEAE